METAADAVNRLLDQIGLPHLKEYRPCLTCGEPVPEGESCPTCSTQITRYTLTFTVKGLDNSEVWSRDEFRQAIAGYLEDDWSGPYDGADHWIVCVEDEMGTSVLAPDDFASLDDPKPPSDRPRSLETR